jgi:hypothetical protein
MGLCKDKLLIQIELPEQLGSSGNAYITYAECAWFESRSEHHLSRLRAFVVIRFAVYTLFGAPPP